MARQIELWPQPEVLHNGILRLSARLERVPGAPRFLWFDMDESYRTWLTARADPWTLATIFSAMRLGQDLRIHGRVSRSLLVNLENFQKIWSCFVSAKFGPLMIFLKRWFAYNKTMRGEMHEYQEETIA